MVKPSNTSAIATTTGRSWADWVQLLDGAQAHQKNHASIASLALELMPASVSQKEWWAQHVAVAYGQHAGLRVPGQSSTGDYQVSTSRTLTGSKDTLLQAWVQLVSSATECNAVPIEGSPSTSSTERWRYWRVALADGSRVVVNIGGKQPGKSVLSLQHTKLHDAAAIEHWRPFWKNLLAQL